MHNNRLCRYRTEGNRLVRLATCKYFWALSTGSETPTYVYYSFMFFLYNIFFTQNIKSFNNIFKRAGNEFLWTYLSQYFIYFKEAE